MLELCERSLEVLDHLEPSDDHTRARIDALRWRGHEHPRGPVRVDSTLWRYSALLSQVGQPIRTLRSAPQVGQSWQGELRDRNCGQILRATRTIEADSGTPRSLRRVAYVGLLCRARRRRRSLATNLLETGADLRYIQELHGHNSSRMTETCTHGSTREQGRTQSRADMLTIERKAGCGIDAGGDRP